MNTCDTPNDSPTNGSVVDARVVFLTHYIPLYQVRVLQEIAKSIREFKILLSTPIEPNRDFRPDWSGLDVSVQQTFTLRRRWRHRGAGFDDPLFVHIPYDTLARLRKLSPQVVFSHELGARSLAAARYCRRSGAKLVLATFMSEHTEQGRGWLRRRVREHLISRADAITYNGPSCREYLLSLGAREDRLFHMPYAADDRTFADDVSARDERSVRRRLLCIGQLSQRKGVLPLIDQLSEFCVQHNESLELTLAGDGPLRAIVESLAKRQASGEHAAPDSRLKINVLGNQPAAELPVLMKQHGALIAPTLADEWLLVVNEAMHAGLPVIGSVYSQAVTTLVQNHHSGWRYDPLHNTATAQAPDAQAPTAQTPTAKLQTLSLSDAMQEYLASTDAQIATMRDEASATAAHYTPQRSAAGAIAAIRSALGTGCSLHRGGLS